MNRISVNIGQTFILRRQNMIYLMKWIKWLIKFLKENSSNIN